jgi:hypothetical protein
VTEKVEAVTVAVAEASEAGGATLQAKKAATEVAAETQVVTPLHSTPRAASSSARGTSAEQGVGQVVDESQQPGWRLFQSQLFCKCQGS